MEVGIWALKQMYYYILHATVRWFVNFSKYESINWYLLLILKKQIRCFQQFL